MTVFTLSYDLRNQSGTQGYEVLYANLKENDCHRIQDSVWLCSFNVTAQQVHEHFKKLVDTDDRLLVVEFTNNHWFSNAMPGTNEWLKKNPPSR